MGFSLAKSRAVSDAANQPVAQKFIGAYEEAVRAAGRKVILRAQLWVLTATQIRVLQARGRIPGNYAMVAVFEQIR